MGMARWRQLTTEDNAVKGCTILSAFRLARSYSSIVHGFASAIMAIIDILGFCISIFGVVIYLRFLLPRNIIPNISTTLTDAEQSLALALTIGAISETSDYRVDLAISGSLFDAPTGFIRWLRRLRLLGEKSNSSRIMSRTERCSVGAVAATFVKLFRTTTPHQLFDEGLWVEIDNGTRTMLTVKQSFPLPCRQQPTTKGPPSDDAKRSPTRFKQIIVKCVLQLLLIETTKDLLRMDEVYRTIPEHLLRLMGVLDHSYQFARMFNEDKEPRSELGLGVLQDYTKLKADTQAKNIAAWTPVVAEVLHGFCKFDDEAFKFSRYLPTIYPLATELLAWDSSQNIWDVLREYFLRVGYAQGIIEPS
ncbi:hypothetical protein EDB83DRAFT_2318817 [Lactarius deliciosus]|nr:hypothetical protein EDB83DRAFT_2318817 [Lactarius deliciosus]